MAEDKNNQFSSVRLGRLDLSPTLVTMEKLFLEKSILDRLPTVEWLPVNKIEECYRIDVDVMVINAADKSAEQAEEYLSSIIRDFRKPSAIVKPLLLVAEVPMQRVMEVWDDWLSTNWYFDVVSPQNLTTLPLRLVNLVRISLHIRELSNLRSEIGELKLEMKEVSTALDLYKKRFQ